jgi:WD40 repeat protein
MSHKKEEGRLSRALAWPSKFLFGDDVFISYSRADGVTYAEGLGDALMARGFTCRVDLWGTESGAEMPRSLKSALRRSAVLVLVGTKGAARSRHVAMEVEVARRLGRKIVPIIFDGVQLRNGFTSWDGRLVKADAVVRAVDAPAAVDEDEALWAADIEGLPISCEKTEALGTGDPSEGLETAVPGGPPQQAGGGPGSGASPEKTETPTGIVNRIEKTHTFKRKDERLRLATRVAAALLLVLIGASVVAGYVATRKGEEATRKTIEAAAAEKRAGEAEVRAKQQEEKARLETARAEAASAKATEAEKVAGEKTKLADEKTKLADEQTRRADEQTRRADEQKRRAETASRRAAEQELSARRNLARSFYAQAQADAATDPLRALAWAGSAVREAPAADENRSSYMLRAVNLASGAPLAVINTPAGVETAAVSPDGQTVVTVTQTGRFSVWDARSGAPLPHPLPDPNAEYVSTHSGGQSPVFSPDGRRVTLPVWAATTPGEAPGPHLLIWEARTGKTVLDVGLGEWTSSSASYPATSAGGMSSLSMAFSPGGGEFIIFNGGDKGMHVWDVATGEQIEYAEPANVRNVLDSTPAGHPRVSRNPARNWFLEVTTDESRATARNEHGEEVETDILRVRDIKTGGSVRELILLDKKRPAPEYVRFVDFTRDAQKVVVTSEAGDRVLLRVWNVVSGRVSEPVVIAGRKGVGGMRRLYIKDARSIGPDGRSLLLVRSDGEKAVGVELWDISGDAPKFSSFHAYDQRTLATIEYVGGRTKSPDLTIYADDGENVIDVSSELEGRREVTVWNLRSGFLLSRPLLVADGGRLLHISTRDKTADVAYRDGTMLTYDLTRDGSLDAKLRRPPSGVSHLFPAPGWGAMLTFGDMPELRDAETWAVKWRADKKFTSVIPPKFSDDGTRFTVVSGIAPVLNTSGGTLAVHRASDGAAEPGFRPIPADMQMAMEFSRDGGALVTKAWGSSDGVAIKRWSAKTGEPLPGPSGELPYKDALFLGFTRFGEFCMTLPPFTFSGIGERSYTDITLRRVDEGLSPVVRLRFADHGTAALAAALFRGAKEIRPAGPDAVVAVLDSGVEVSAAASPAGAALTNERTKRRLVPPVDLAADLSALVVSPDGRLVAAPLKSNAQVSSRVWEAGSKTYARVWDAATGLPLSDHLWHESALKSLAFSHDGQRLMTATERGTLREWFFGDFAGGTPAWAAHMGEALGGMRVVQGLDAQRLSAEEHARSRREFEAELARAAEAGDEAARFLLTTLRR